MFSFSLRRFHNLFIAPALLIFAVSAHAQNPMITLTGHVVYSTGQPAAGATVTLTKNVYIVNPNEVSYDHTAAEPPKRGLDDFDYQSSVYFESRLYAACKPR